MPAKAATKKPPPVRKHQLLQLTMLRCALGELYPQLQSVGVSDCRRLSLLDRLTICENMEGENER